MKQKGAKNWLEPIAVRLETHDLEEVKEIAGKESMTKSAVGKMLIEMGLEVYKQKGSATKEVAHLRKKLKIIRDVIDQNGI